MSYLKTIYVLYCSYINYYNLELNPFYESMQLHFKIICLNFDRIIMTYFCVLQDEIDSAWVDNLEKEFRPYNRER